MASTSDRPSTISCVTELDLQSRTTRVRVWDPACADHEPDPGTPLEWGQTESTRAMPPHTPSRHRRPNNLSSSSIQQRVSHVRKLISAPDEPYTRARWRSWFDNSMLLTLDSNFQEVQRDIGSIHSLLSRHKLTNELRHWKRVRRNFQRSVYTALHNKHAPDAHLRFAQKLHRWKLHVPTHPLQDHLSITQGTRKWQARSAHQRLKTIATLTTPRVHAAVYGAIWNRWCTLRRFQLRGHCRLCQLPHTEDSIEYFGFCPTVEKLATKRLRLCIITQVNTHTSRALIRCSVRRNNSHEPLCSCTLRAAP